jgi:hypothetical protein
MGWNTFRAYLRDTVFWWFGPFRRAGDEALDARAFLFGLKRRRYFWGLFVETDRRLRQRVRDSIRTPLGPPIGEFVRTVSPGVVELQLNRRGRRKLADVYDIRRRWWWSRRRFARHLAAAFKRHGPVGLSVGYTLRGEPLSATIMPRKKQ